MSASASSEKPPREKLQPFPRTFYVANGIELCERLAHYGFYIGLSLYLSNIVKMSDIEVGVLLGNWRLVGSLSPVVCGSIADRITFKRSLILAFTLYASAYIALMAFPTRAVVIPALFVAAIAGGFMKPVILGTVVRTSPPGRQEEGFGTFYRMINTGSVIGKTLAYGVRRIVALRFVAGTSVIASLVALGLAVFGYEEPKDDAAKEKAPPLSETLRGYGQALANLRFTAFLVVFAGFWFMAEQFYMTFPKYVTRHIDEKAPLEIITLVNPALIAIFQGTIIKLTKRFDPMRMMAAGVCIGALSMFVMGAIPTILGALLSGGIFAFAEMTFSPRFYDQVARFAPKGKAGMYMGLAFVPAALGAWIGGMVSGPMIAKYIPATGPRDPFKIWSIYAGLGLTCALAMVAYSVLNAALSARSYRTGDSSTDRRT